MTPQLALTDVGQAFREHEVLLTGANGFLGKVILGLILDRFPDFNHLHILLRRRGELSASERFFSETLGSPALQSVVQRRGLDTFRSRITVWPGDISQADCGIDAAGLEGLGTRASLVINCAGNVDFFAPVDQSFASNVDGVEHVVALTRSLGAKWLHVSTCYVRGQADGLVEETEPILGFYPRRSGPEDASFNHADEITYCRERIRHIYRSAQGSSAGWETGDEASGADARGKDLTDRLITLGRQRAEHWGWVNTYTYAKSLGEQIIAAADDLDWAIVRPAIVESALNFPFPGWIEGGRTAAPLVLMALGGLKDWPVRKDMPLEVVPVDMVASAILVAGALLLDGRHEAVYQLGTADVNPLLLGPLVTLLDAEARRRRNGTSREAGHGNGTELPPLVGRWLGAAPGRPVRFVSAKDANELRQAKKKRNAKINSIINTINKMDFSRHLPGGQFLASLATALRTVELQAGFRERILDQYLPFILENCYIFESENIRAAYAQIPVKARELLPWNPEQIDWKSYWINNQIPGVERWVQPEAVKKWTFKI